MDGSPGKPAGCKVLHAMALRRAVFGDLVGRARGGAFFHLTDSGPPVADGCFHHAEKAPRVKGRARIGENIVRRTSSGYAAAQRTPRDQRFVGKSGLMGRERSWSGVVDRETPDQPPAPSLTSSGFLYSSGRGRFVEAAAPLGFGAQRAGDWRPAAAARRGEDAAASA